MKRSELPSPATALADAFSDSKVQVRKEQGLVQDKEQHNEAATA